MLLASPCAAAPLEVYGRLPSIEDVALSPNGARIAFIPTNGIAREIIVANADGSQKAPIPYGDYTVRSLIWADDENLLVTTTWVSEDKKGRTREETDFEVLNVKSRERWSLLKEAGPNIIWGTANGAPMIRRIKGSTVVFIGSAHAIGEKDYAWGLFGVDLSTRALVTNYPGSKETIDWLVDADGVLMAEERRDEATGAETLLVHKGDKVTTVNVPTGLGNGVNLVGTGRGGRSVLMSLTREDAFVLSELSGDTATWGEPYPVLDPGGVILDPATRRFTGFRRLEGDVLSYTFFEQADQAGWNRVESLFPGVRVDMVDWSDNHKRYVVHADSPVEGPSLAVVDVEAGKVWPIGPVYADLKPADISPVRPIAFKAADGTALTGYLTTPNGREARGLPLVTLVHGGPASRDRPGFHWWAQALASRGYAVLQVNYRGSRGFGLAFYRAGFGQWGRKMQTDVSDGVRHLASQGLIDPARVCIVGGSYGGYAALAGATIDRGVYRCAASVAGVSDLNQMLTTDQERGGQSALRYWARFMGVEGKGDPALAALSPALLASKVEIPVLLVHGRNDNVVLYDQSERMAKAMTKARKPVEFVTLDGEDHYLSQGETRLKMLRSVVAFLEKHNPVSPPARVGGARP